MHAFEAAVIELVRSLFATLGWAGVVIAMAIESACIPLPSEIIMPLAGWLLVAEHDLGWSGVVQAGMWGAVGNLLGSSLAYAVGAYGGRPLIERYGTWILITRKDLDRADRWFARWGEATAFLARLVPVVRTFNSFPAGVARMPFGRFALFTFAGSFLWSLALAAIGYRWGPAWEEFRERARFLDYPIAAIVVALVAWYISHKLRELRDEARAASGLERQESDGISS
jgi:membrane protein DedA with SNARE-associated domain